jgi:hypothetical protein
MGVWSGDFNWDQVGSGQHPIIDFCIGSEECCLLIPESMLVGSSIKRVRISEMCAIVVRFFTVRMIEDTLEICKFCYSYFSPRKKITLRSITLKFDGKKLLPVEQL